MFQGFRRLGVVLALSGAIVVPRQVLAQDSDNVEPWRIITPAQSSLVYARDGSLIGEFGRQLRTSISIRTLP
ncbi:MAG TPA: hypothetical protein VJ672_14395, partial [Gemmatimonadaceae bacterium]|nr:hypothetical protein [Gemmatimonadaceae bacterium]